MNKSKFIITTELSSSRLDKVLPLLMSDLSRTKAQELIDNHSVSVNGKFESSSYKVRENDEILVIIYDEEDSNLKEEDIPLDIRYEDDDVIVINKEAGMVVHPSFGHSTHTLVNALLYHFKELSSLSGEDRPGIVHRIDKETSGLVMVAKNDFTHKALQEQLKDKTAYRRYICLIHGEMVHNSGTIIAPIGRHKKDRKKMAVVDDGKDAITHFKVLERFSGYTLLECLLETGRTHQIRVHLSAAKYPIVGDIIYGPKKVALDHMLLHATSLGFIHPRSGQRVIVNCPLPDYFEEVLNNLRKYGKLEKEN